jgi:hypothetical protein
MNTIKQWLARLRASKALDELEPAGRPERRLEGNSEATRFASPIEEVDRRLREASRTSPETPPWLHEGIMNAVRTEAARPRGMFEGAARWVWAPGLATLLVVGAAIVALVLHDPRSSDGELLSEGHAPPDVSSMLATGTPRQVLDEVALLGAAAMTGPFATEWESLSNDADRAAEFLLAALP